mmetsp:Transcript_31325/g.44476  ORF Transcript_31325/g.44476 Transcript_31325/m.44476 type:complete len:134 (+) Transcript_31325:138-539(+)
MESQTLGAICMGPTGNQQGGHYFLFLRTGREIVRYNWTELPTPKDAIDHVNYLGRNMPASMNFGDRWGQPIWDDAGEVDDDHDSVYAPGPDDPSDEIIHSGLRLSFWSQLFRMRQLPLQPRFSTQILLWFLQE